MKNPSKYCFSKETVVLLKYKYTRFIDLPCVTQIGILPLEEKTKNNIIPILLLIDTPIVNSRFLLD